MAEAATADSDGPGRGSRFTVRLPFPATQIDDPAAVPRVTRALPVDPSRRIIIADDNHDAANALAVQLGLAGHSVEVVHDGLQALAIGATFEPDVVLL